MRLLKDIPSHADAIVLPGGLPGAKNLAASEAVAQLLVAMNETGKIIAAICASPAIVLAPLGILNGKKATCYPGMQEQFPADTKYVEESVVRDGNVITSRGPGTALDFALAIVAVLTDPATAEKIKKATLHT